MRKLFSLKYHAVHFTLVLLYLLALISTTLGLFGPISETKCEYEDANLIWRNIPAYSLHDVKAMAWYNGKGSLIATWLEGKGFVEYPPYIGRLLQIGETGIKIRTVNRSDSGTYWLSLTLVSVDHKLEAASHLVVKVAPSSRCKPEVKQEGSILKAELPSEGCGTPHLTLKWKHTNKTVIQDNSSSLDLGSNPEPGEYTVCAEGESATCYQRNISDLCTKYIITDGVQKSIGDHGSTPGVVTIILVTVVVVVVVSAVIVVVVRCRHGIKDRKQHGNVGNVARNEAIYSNEESKSDGLEMSTIGDAHTETSIKGNVLLEIQNHLKKLYESLLTVPLSPTGEKHHVSVSDFYVDSNIEKVEFTDLDNETSNSFTDTPHDSQPLISTNEAATKQNKQFGPIFIFGVCGIGKSTWCKHVVKCWLQNSDTKFIHRKDVHLPDLRNIKILLYLPLQFSDRGRSLQELLRKQIFKENSTYLEFVMKYVETNAHDLLIVMDGLDIIKENAKLLSELLHPKLMSSSSVIVTSRPASLKLLRDMCHDEIEQVGLFRFNEMTLEGSRAYANRLLENMNRLHGRKFEFDNFWRFTEHLQVQHLLRVPYICLLILHVWMENKNLFIEVTDILFHITNYYCQRATTDTMYKQRFDKIFGGKSAGVQKYISKLSHWPLLIQNEYLLCVLSDVAFKNSSSEIRRNSPNLSVPDSFWATDEDGVVFQVICETGLLTDSLSLSPNKNVSYLSFTDRITSEFFASIFIALHEGKECDFIVSSMSSCLQNSMIIHMLFQLSKSVIEDIMVKAIKHLDEDRTKTWSADESGDDLNEKCRYSITKKKFIRRNPVVWLQLLLHNDVLNQQKLLFLTTALHFINNLTSLVLENHENNENLVFQLPLLSKLETLTLNINKCTLLLCKEWVSLVPRRLKEVVIKSVKANTSTLCVLTKTLSQCADLKKLELFPSEIWTNDTDILTEMSDLTNNSLHKQLENMLTNKTPKILMYKLLFSSVK